MGKNAIDSSVVVKNIESELKEFRLSKSEFYSKSGITSATLSQWRSGTYAPSQEKLAAAANVLGVSAIWLLTEHNDASAETEKNSIPSGFLPMPEMAQVPLVGRIACGTPITAEQTVWIPTNGGTKYHKDADCSDMINPQQVSLEYAEAHGFEPCKLCQ